MSTATLPNDQQDANALLYRDPQGRFEIGNPGGPGNPFARRVAELRKAMLAAVSAEDIAAILQALIVKAKEGHVQAAKLVLGYTLGKPQPVADPDRVDAHEWEVQKETANMMNDMVEVVQAPPADVPLGHARLFRPLIGSDFTYRMVEAMRTGNLNPLGSPISGRGKAPDQEVAPLASPPPADLQELLARRGQAPPPKNGQRQPSANGKMHRAKSRR